MNGAPVLLCAFRRPGLAESIARNARNYSNGDLYVFVDKGKNAIDQAASKATRLALSKAELGVADFIESDNALGCGAGVAFAITEFLKLHPYGIILEDDTLPAPGFYDFVTALLQKLMDNDRFFMVSGRNDLGHYAPRNRESFTSTGGTWGWGTWDRAWKHFSLDISLTEEQAGLQTSETLRRYQSIAPVRYQQISKGLESVRSGRLDTWDYQWAFTRLQMGGLSVTPRNNLVWNLGTGDFATHTKTLPPEPALYIKNEAPNVAKLSRDFDANYLRQTTTPLSARSRVNRLLKGARKRLASP
jgi:hypothetical protein